MRRWARYTLNALSLLSLGSFALVASSWIRSYGVPRSGPTATLHDVSFANGEHRWREWDLSSVKGRLGFAWGEGRESIEQLRSTRNCGYGEMRFARTARSALEGTGNLSVGDEWIGGTYVQFDEFPGRTVIRRIPWSEHVHWLVASHMLLAALTAFLPTLRCLPWAARVILTKRRPSPGLCPRCRYDLTGNVSGTCPECGRPVVAAAAAAGDAASAAPPRGGGRGPAA